uniref:Uncharacterized protein n=1 Tax=Anopheles atroparvus TaxID=41427 RepID=A0A182JBZ1_ANOAO
MVDFPTPGIPIVPTTIWRCFFSSSWWRNSRASWRCELSEQTDSLPESVPSDVRCCCSQSDSVTVGWPRCWGTCGLVGLASGLRELVRGGGGGGTRLLFTFESSSALRSGTGGFPVVGRVGCGGLVSVSEPLGYE